MTQQHTTSCQGHRNLWTESTRGRYSENFNYNNNFYKQPDLQNFMNITSQVHLKFQGLGNCFTEHTVFCYKFNLLSQFCILFGLHFMGLQGNTV